MHNVHSGKAATELIQKRFPFQSPFFSPWLHICCSSSPLKWSLKLYSPELLGPTGQNSCVLCCWVLRSWDCKEPGSHQCFCRGRGDAKPIICHEAEGSHTRCLLLQESPEPAFLPSFLSVSSQHRQDKYTPQEKNIYCFIELPLGTDVAFAFSHISALLIEITHIRAVRGP